MKKILILLMLSTSIVHGAEDKKFDDSVIINGTEYANINTIVEASQAKMTKEIVGGVKRTALGMAFMWCVLKLLASQATEIVKALVNNTANAPVTDTTPKRV